MKQMPHLRIDNQILCYLIPWSPIQSLFLLQEWINSFDLFVLLWQLLLLFNPFQKLDNLGWQLIIIFN